MLAQRTKALLSRSKAGDNRAAVKAAAKERDIIDFTVSEVWSDLAPSIRDGAIAAINCNINHCNDTLGLAELRRALARRISVETGQPWSEDQVAVTSGAKQALFNAAMALLNPGDEVLIPSPYPTTFPAQISIAGGVPVFVETRYNKYIPKLADLAAAVTPKTKAIMVNTPNNPTGVIYDRNTLAGIAQLAIERDFWIIFDESYGAFAHPPHTHHSILSLMPRASDRTLMVNSFSKSLALTGWRIGYLAGPKEIICATEALQECTTAGTNVIAQHALLRYLERGDLYFETMLRRHVANARALGLSVLSALKLVPQPPAEGGFYFYLDLTELQRCARVDGGEVGADDVVRTLLANGGIATVSGTVFGDPAGIRLSYGIDLESVNKGLQSVTEILNALSFAAEQ